MIANSNLKSLRTGSSWANNSCIQWTVRAALSCLALVVFSPAARGQSFLEKLESVVRDKLNTPAADAKPSDSKTPKSTQPSQSKPPLPKPPQSSTLVPPPSGEVGEELPAPRREPDATNSLRSGSAKSGDMPSIIERGTPRASQELELSPATKEPLDAATNEPPAVYLGLEVEELVGGGIGVRVSKLSENSPAWKAGFKVGDLLQAIDGHAIADLDGMANRLRRVMPGKPTKFLVKRAGRNLELTAVLQSAALAERLGETDPADGAAFLGVTASDLTPAFRTQFGLAVFSGAAVTNVARESPAYAAGIRPGDAIVEVNGTPIESADDLLSWIASAQVGQPAEVMVYRGTQVSMKSLVLSSLPTPADLLDRPRSTPRMPAVNPSRVPDNLQVEVEQLRAELAQTQQQLIQTQRRLDQVLQQLDRNQ